MYPYVIIGSLERGLLFKNKQFQRVLPPGKYWCIPGIGSSEIKVVNIDHTPELHASITQLLLRRTDIYVDKEISDFFERITTEHNEVALVYRDGRIALIIAPNQDRLFWKGLYEYTERKINVASDYQLDLSTVAEFTNFSSDEHILKVMVPQEHKGLLFESGVLVRELEPGRYAFLKALREISVMVVDTRLTTIEVNGQEMLTKDKVSLRINLSVSYRIADPATAFRTTADIHAEIYRTAQLALRQQVGERTLDTLLESKEALNRELTDFIVATLSTAGITISRTGVRDLILPGDMRTLLNRVVEAEKAAEAQNIRRREETAATRSLLNTAKLMESNPVLLRLKELEAVVHIPVITGPPIPVIAGPGFR